MADIFKLNYTQLQLVLPTSAFDSLDTALSAACKAMNYDEAYDEAYLRLGLEQSLSVISREEPLDVLKQIRKWALECLKDEPLHDMISKTPIWTTTRAGSDTIEKFTRKITAKQARGILANVFFSNCLDPASDLKDHWHQGGLDWRPLLVSQYAKIGIERMRCHLLYFEQKVIEEKGDCADNERLIIFECIHYKPVDFFNLEIADLHTFVGEGVHLHDKRMENPPSSGCMTGFVNFANANFGYGKFSISCTQEEILESCCPEFTVGMLWIGQMGDNEVVNVQNVRRFSVYSGYLRTFRCQGLLSELVVHDILTMDACFENHFDRKNIQRDLNKAYFAFKTHDAAVRCSGRNGAIVSTGKWGCGAFGGITAHKFVQQALAASLAGVQLDFSAFGNPESCDVLLKAMQKRKPSPAEVANALEACKKENSFVEDFLAAI